MGKEYEREITVLGSVPYLGRVMLYDDMEDLLKFVKGGTGGDDVFEKDQTQVYNGDYSLHMKTRTTGAAEDDDIWGERYLFQRPGERYRLECLFHHKNAVAGKYVNFEIFIQDATTYHQVRIRYNVATEYWMMFRETEYWGNIQGGSQNLNQGQYHRFLMEWDQYKKEFRRFVCDGLEIDMKGMAYASAGNVQFQYMKLVLGCEAGAGPPAEVFFDDVLVLEL